MGKGSRRRPDRFRRALLVGLTVLAVMLAACSTNTTSPVGAAPDRAADMGTFYAQKLSWGPCRSFTPSTDYTEMVSRPDFDCAYLTVPPSGYHDQPDDAVP